MPFNFSVSCKNARELITVPTIPLAAIRNAAESGPFSRSSAPRKGPIAALMAGACVAAVAAAAEVWSGTHVSFNPSGPMQLSTHRLSFTKNPTIGDLRSAARHADFPVILPSGLPEGTTLGLLARAGSSALLFQYNLPGAWRRSNHVLSIVIANPQTLSVAPRTVRGDYTLELGGTAARGGVRWIIGREEVMVLQSTLTTAELTHIKSTMIAQSRLQDAPR